MNTFHFESALETRYEMITLSPLNRHVKEYVQLTRPRIVLMVLFALAVAAWCCGDAPPSWLQLLHAIVGTALITAGSVALNQWYEQRSDALMARTRNRPIPTGRIPSRRALAFGVGISVLGMIYLLVFSTPLVASVAALNWVFYVACYTPLKSISVWQLPVGAIAGAMPMVIGGSVAAAPLSSMTLMLFAIVFFWQFPHAIAIAWIYREHYAAANLQVASVKDPSGKLAGILAVTGAAILLPVSLLPTGLQYANLLFGLVAAVTGIAYLVLSLQFLKQRQDAQARKLLWASFLYLPAILVTLLFTT
jgi:protoheme IX farnesyltransferase